MGPRAAGWPCQGVKQEERALPGEGCHWASWGLFSTLNLDVPDVRHVKNKQKRKKIRMSLCEWKCAFCCFACTVFFTNFPLITSRVCQQPTRRPMGSSRALPKAPVAHPARGGGFRFAHSPAPQAQD